MEPTTILTLALVAGAVLGTLARLVVSPAFATWSKELVVELVSNGVAAVLIPHLGAVVTGLDITAMPPLAAGAAMFFIASGSGDFVGNIRKKFTGGV